MLLATSPTTTRGKHSHWLRRTCCRAQQADTQSGLYRKDHAKARIHTPNNTQMAKHQAAVLSWVLDATLQQLQRVECIVAQDVARPRRSMQYLVVPGALASSSAVLMSSRHPLVMTGFPCRIGQSPPTENDGPPGAAAIVRMCARLGKPVTVMTDASSAVPVFEAARLAWRQGGQATSDGLRLVAIDPPSESGIGRSAEVARTEAARAAAGCDAVVAIERAGVSKHGDYRTMRSIPMPGVAPLEAAATAVSSQHRSGDDEDVLRFRVVAIGDGGNEHGMGPVADRVEAFVGSGEDIACREPSDFVVGAGVSNWGAWGLCAGVELLLRQAPKPPSDSARLSPALAAALVPREGVSMMERTAGLEVTPRTAVFLGWRTAEAQRCRERWVDSKRTFAVSSPGDKARPEAQVTLLPSEAEELAVMDVMARERVGDGTDNDMSGRQVDGLPWDPVHRQVLLDLETAVRA